MPGPIPRLYSVIGPDGTNIVTGKGWEGTLAAFFRLFDLLPVFDLEKIRQIREVVVQGVATDGGHHKQFALEEVARLLGIVLPEHEPGIPG